MSGNTVDWMYLKSRRYCVVETLCPSSNGVGCYPDLERQSGAAHKKAEVNQPKNPIQKFDLLWDV